MYFLFAGDTFYPAGGMDDLVGTFATLEEARAAVAEPGVDEDGFQIRYDWWQIATVRDGELGVVEASR